MSEPSALFDSSLVLLAAGKSSRMGFPKAKLHWQGQPLLQTICDVAHDAGVARIVLVVGQPSPVDPNLLSTQDAEAMLAGSRAKALLTTVCEGCPAGDPMDSIRRGLTHVPDHHAVLLWPVDHPFATAALVRALLEAVRAVPLATAQPQVAGRRGHPVAFGSRAAETLRKAPQGATARTILRAANQKRLTVASDDHRLVATMNTPQEASALGVVTPPAL